MAAVSVFRRLDQVGSHETGAWVEVLIDGKTVQAREGEPVAAAMLASGLRSCRTTPISNTTRAPFCMMGVCYECLVVIDGVPNRQACRVPVTAGLVIERQSGAGTTDDGAEQTHG